MTIKNRRDPKQAQPYHHGNLRAALLKAAEAELAEHGIEGFSLRGVVKRAGVSHAAPAHHFGDSNGLLTALAAEGFSRFIGAQLAHQANAAPGGIEQCIASGIGYVDFAMAHPALFRLMFSSDRPNYDEPGLSSVANAAITKLIDDVRAAGGSGDGSLPLDHVAVLDIAAAWALAHGLADLMITGRLQYLLELICADRQTTLTDLLPELLRRALGERP